MNTNNKILIADDDAAIQAMLKSVLGRKGYSVLTAYDGTRVVDLALHEDPVLILLDVNMPGKKGGEVLRELRAHSKTKMIPVIFQTGAGSPADVVNGLSTGADDYLCKPFSIDELLARIDSVLRRCTVNLDANPLTKLPGSGIIEREMMTLLDQGSKFSVLYLDLNDFKAYNDHYGAHRGDDVIRATADLLREVCEPRGHFVGHIGGDDFVVIVEEENVEPLCQKILTRFDDIIPEYYDEADRKAGFIMVSDRRGINRAFSPVSIAIGVVTNHTRPLRSIMEISAIGAEVKSVAKRCEGSSFFIDRRQGVYNALRLNGLERVHADMNAKEHGHVG